MKKHTKAIKTLFEVVLLTVVPMIATINCETHMPDNPESAFVCGFFLTDVSLHTDSPEHEQGPPAPFLNKVKSRYCRTNIDHIRDH
jgi:hypothetical protein